MSDHEHSENRNVKRSRRRSSTSPRRSRSQSSPRRSRSRSPRRVRRSPMSSFSNHRYGNDGKRTGPKPSAVLGVFGLSRTTTERVLRDLFNKYARVKNVQIVIDRKTQKSRGFGFIYFDDVQNATRAKEALSDLELDGRRVRIDYSTTNGAHDPTPGIYMGDRNVGLNRSSTITRRPQGYRKKRSRSRSRSRSHSRSRTRHNQSRHYNHRRRSRD
ncbi:unnamed protein product [Adineta steineri]|uniref:RRM domain-containing protein n=1 Tax=Adineta steineri TaxID=433720 RepID=A0A818UZS2_9BILA|nr:unnamed protein product [Adineta steineri]